MKRLLSIGLFIVAVTIASAQMPTPCLNQMPDARASSEQSLTPRAAVYRSSRFSPMVSYSRYSVGNEVRFGPSLILQVSMFRTKSEAIDILGGLMFRYRSSSEPVDLNEYAPLGLRRYYSSYQSSRGIRLGMGFIGMDYTFYLTDGDVRPYVGLGAMLMGWPYQGGIAGTIAPTAKSGLQADLASGFWGYVELKHVFGNPMVVGVDSPPLRGFTGLAFGFAFAPRWN